MPDVLDVQMQIAAAKENRDCGKAARFVAEVAGAVRGGQSIQNTTNVVTPISYEGETDEEFNARFDRAMKERGVSPDED